MVRGWGKQPDPREEPSAGRKMGAPGVASRGCGCWRSRLDVEVRLDRAVIAESGCARLGVVLTGCNRESSVRRKAPLPNECARKAHSHRLDWALQVNRIVAATNRYNHAEVHVDTTGVGEPLYESLFAWSEPLALFVPLTLSPEFLGAPPLHLRPQGQGPRLPLP